MKGFETKEETAMSWVRALKANGVQYEVVDKLPTGEGDGDGPEADDPLILVTFPEVLYMIWVSAPRESTVFGSGDRGRLEANLVALAAYLEAR